LRLSILFLIVGALLCAQVTQGELSPFKDAVPGRVLIFPRDYGKHPDFQTEWWYFTGNLASKNDTWGFQLTFFRRSLLKERAPRDSVWAVRDLYPAHFALSDIGNRKFFHTDMISREGPGLAGASSEDLNVWIKDWSARREGDSIRINAAKDGYAITLDLASEKAPVLHGDRGYSRKGDSEGQASYYYSLTRLKANGTVTFDGKSHQVTGYAWMDQEFGSSILLPDQVGWDWFSLQLDDGTELMLFHLRKNDGTMERPFGTFVPKEGPSVDLGGKEITIDSHRVWTSPHTKAVYPMGWKIEIPERNIRLTLVPAFEDQELTAAKSTAVTYWEGSVAVEGMSSGHSVRGRGYVELTGYAHSMGGRL
jgi:predicted secreted hydrolase